MDKQQPPKFQDIQDIFDSFLLLEDRNLIWLTMAIVIGNQMPNRRPIWMMLVAPPSSGKTTALNALMGMKLYNKLGEAVEPIHNISDLTENSFASGSKVRTEKGEEASLLARVKNGDILVFKDFTSVLSKNSDAKRIIMGQLREIYDGSYVKRTGNGSDFAWTGKLGALAGVTESIYQHLESMSVMGDRFMLYQVPQPDRKKMLRFKLDQERDGKTEDIQMPLAKQLVHDYIQYACGKLQDNKIVLPRDAEDEIIAVADFCTMVRSGIITNEFSGEIMFVPQPEMPARMFEQLLGLGSTFSFMRRLDNSSLSDEQSLTAQDIALMYKIAYDSIPITRRIALNYLVRFSAGVETYALAMKTNYPTKVVGAWLEQLNALGVVTRGRSLHGGNLWKLRPEYIALMETLQGVAASDDELNARDVDENDDHENFWDKEAAEEQRVISSEELQEALANDPDNF